MKATLKFCCLFTTIVTILSVTPAFAAAPNLINYQGRLTNSSGQPVADGSYSVNFTLYDAPSGGTPQWGETQTVTATNGLFSVRLGSVIFFSADLFNDTSLYLAIKVGADPEISPRTRLTAVPYALSSGDGWTHEGATVHLTTNTDAVGIGTSTPIHPLHVVDPSGGVFPIRIEGSHLNATAAEFSNSTSGATWEYGVAGASGVFFGSVAPGNAYFYKQGASYPAIVMTSTNRVGMGTGAPISQLDVQNPVDTIVGYFRGETSSFGGAALMGENQSPTTGDWSIGIAGKSMTSGYGIGGKFDGTYIGSRNSASSASNATALVIGTYSSADGDGIDTKMGVESIVSGNNGDKYGVYTTAIGTGGKAVGVYGYASGGEAHGLYGEVAGLGSNGVYALASGDLATGVRARSSGFGSSQNVGIDARATGSGTNLGVYGEAYNGTVNFAGYFSGNVYVNGTLSKTAGSFKIDHPLDPENKYLQHSFVESPDMMNIYNGNVITDAAGNATITLPNWFEALNRDFRYQLTVIGQFAQAIVSSKISGNQFSIRTDKPTVEVSWQVTGVRKDPYAEQNRIQVELEKNERERGKFVSPESYGKGPELGIGYRKEMGELAPVQRPPADDDKLKASMER